MSNQTATNNAVQATANTAQVDGDLASKLVKPNKPADPIQQIKQEVEKKAKADKLTAQQKLDKKLADLASVANAIAKARIQADATLETCDKDKAEKLLADSQSRLEKFQSALSVKANNSIAPKIEELLVKAKVDVDRIEKVVSAIAVKVEAKAKAEAEKLAQAKQEKNTQVSLEVGVDPIVEARQAAEKCRIPQFVSLKKVGYAIKIQGTVKTVNGISFYIGEIYYKKTYLGLLTQEGFLVEDEDDQHDSYMIEQLLPAINEITYPFLLAKKEASEQKKAEQLEQKLEAAKRFWERKAEIAKADKPMQLVKPNR